MGGKFLKASAETFVHFAMSPRRRDGILVKTFTGTNAYNHGAFDENPIILPSRARAGDMESLYEGGGGRYTGRWLALSGGAPWPCPKFPRKLCRTFRGNFSEFPRKV